VIPSAADGGGEEALLLVVGAELPDRRRGDADVRPDPGRQPARPGPAELLVQNGVLEIAAAAPAVLDRVLQPEQPELGHTVEDLVRKPLGRLPVGSVRPQLVRHEAPDLLAQPLMLVRERWCWVRANGGGEGGHLRGVGHKSRA
jgi:hypothetical protein